MPEIVSTERFRARLKEPGELVAVFYAEWCPFCRRFLAELDAKGPSPRTVVVDVSDEDDPIWEDFDVRFVPTAARFVDGREVGRAGAIPAVGLSWSRFAALEKARP